MATCTAWLRRACLIAMVSAALISPGLVRGQDAEERVRQLEQQIQALTQELQALKEQIRQLQAREASGTDQTAAVKRAQAEAAAAASQIAELRDRVQAAEQRLEQAPQSRLANGLMIEDSRGDWSARFNGRVQGDYRHYDPADALPQTFSVRRARLGLELTAFRKYVFFVEGEFITGNAQGNTTQGTSLTHAYLDLNWVPWARPRIGQFKPPIGLENSAADGLTDFQERSLTQSLLQNLNYDRGIMLQGAPHKGLYYGASFTNGTGLNLEERNGSAQDVEARDLDLTARVALNLAPLFKWKDTVTHLGLDYKQGTVSNAPTQGSSGTAGFVAATGRTEAFGTTFFTPQAFNGVGGVTAAGDIDRTLQVAELALAWKRFKLQGESWKATYEGEQQAPNAVAFSRDIDAHYLSAFWMITGESYADLYGGNATFGRIRPRNNLGWGKDGGAGAWEVGLRYSRFDASDFDNNNLAGTGALGASAPTTVSTDQAKAWTLMVKWIVNPYVRLLLNHVDTEFDTPVTTNTVSYDDERAITFRAQFDF